ncbi:MAG: hypothetical protein RLP02_19030 [Coleofasciculus sp. C2-GNP5-27]
MTWQLIYTKQAQKDAKKLSQSNLRDKAQALLDMSSFVTISLKVRSLSSLAWKCKCYIWH